MAKQTQSKTKKPLPIEIVVQTTTIVANAFSLVAALAWNSAIQQLFTDGIDKNPYVRNFLPAGSGDISRFLYAFLVTIIAVVFTIQLTRFAERFER